MELLIFVEIGTPVDREQSRNLVLVVTIFKVFEHIASSFAFLLPYVQGEEFKHQ